MVWLRETIAKPLLDLIMAVHLLASILLLSTLPIVGFSIIVSIGSCEHSSCKLSIKLQSSSPDFCYCDSSCTVYGDCCHDANVTNKTPFNSRFSCEETTKYWMITACSPSWVAEQVADGVANVQDIVSSCEDPSVRATYRFLPPVTDEVAGLVYRNEFCARCNGLQPSDVTGWTIDLVCVNSTELNTRSSLTFSELIGLCQVKAYIPQESFLPLRTCKIVPRGLIYSCPNNTSANMRESCTSGGLNIVQFGSHVYANEYCAACWNVSSILIRCGDENILPSGPGFIGNIAILFDVYGTGRTAASSSRTYHIVEEACPSGSVYDVFKGSCRMLPSVNCTNVATLTLEGGSYTLLNSDSVFWNSYNLSVSIESVDTNGRPLVCIPSVESTTCVPIFLESNEYTKLGNSSRTLVWTSDNANYIIEGYDAAGRPLICTNLTRNRTRTFTPFAYPIAFDILTYIGFTVDFVSGLLFLLTFFLFKELRTFFSKLMVNFICSILFGDIIFLIGGPLFTFLNVSPLCTAIGIFLHYAFLCRFSWMAVMGSELVRSFYNVLKRMNKNNTSTWKFLVVYMLVAWLSPLLIVIPTIIVNFTLSASVDYGVGGSCWINQHVALIVAFVLPVTLFIVYNTSAFVVVMVMVVQMRRGSMTKLEELTSRRRISWKDVRFAFAVFTLTGLSWLFGFLALFSPALSWAWYLFIIFNTTQALAVTVAFLLTKKVIRLYHSLLCCSRRPLKRSTTSKSRIVTSETEL